eukprot:scaffold53168_cov75-Phaeocystis_antarctica.AAC.3
MGRQAHELYWVAIPPQQRVEVGGERLESKHHLRGARAAARPAQQLGLRVPPLVGRSLCHPPQEALERLQRPLLRLLERQAFLALHEGVDR